MAATMLKAVLFDMDGVIIDSEPFHCEVEMAVVRELGGDLTREEYNRFTGTTTRYMFSQIKERFRLPQSVEELVERVDRRYLQYLRRRGDLRPIPGVAALLDGLSSRGISRVVASSAPADHIEYVLERLGLRSCFQRVVSGVLVANSKPAPDIFLHSARLCGVQPAECVVIEDSGNGVLAAKAAGMKCVGLRNPNSRPQDLSAADLQIDGFAELSVERLQELVACG